MILPPFRDGDAPRDAMRQGAALDRIVAFCLVAHDGAALARFYAALGFVQEGAAWPIAAAESAILGLAGGGMRRAMRLGTARLWIDQYDWPGRPYPEAADAASSCFQHFALATDDIEAAWKHTQAAGATPISRTGPVTLPASSGGVIAVKFRDPEGHPLELIHFPDGGRRGWRGQGILGIDHSAIAVADVERSRAFYRAHGLACGDATLNRGPTQVALDGLDGVRVDVVPMHPAGPGPHVELLHYRHPQGTPPVEPWAIHDVAATRIVWQGSAPTLLRDPDGHIHQIAGAAQAGA
ncbi:VOC family protein [Acidovorax sacchari]|uniref:VOC family protein n=1 Tax=Acidovorax sacchari TaxID=3230736 RepID=UPI0039E668EA